MSLAFTLFHLAFCGFDLLEHFRNRFDQLPDITLAGKSKQTHTLFFDHYEGNRLDLSTATAAATKSGFSPFFSTFSATTAKTEAIGRLVSLALRSGVNVEKIIEQLKGIGGEHPVFQKDGLVLSIPDAIGRVLEKKYLKNGLKKDRRYSHGLRGETCPDCGQTITREEGCMTCHSCGYTKCM